jgi:hypothetical protein
VNISDLKEKNKADTLVLALVYFGYLFGVQRVGEGMIRNIFFIKNTGEALQYFFTSSSTQ